MGILLLATMSLIVNQNTEIRVLKEKLGETDFEQQFIRSFADGTVCASLLHGLNFDSTNAVAGSTNPPTITLPNTSIPINTTPSAPALATAGQPLSPISPSFVAAPTQTFQVTHIVGSSSGGVGNYTATFQVNYDQTKVVRSLHPATTQISFQTTSAGSTQTITSCNGSLANQVALGGLYQYYVQCGNQDGPCQNANGSWTCGAGGVPFNGSCNNACRHPNPLTGKCTCPAGFTAHMYFDFQFTGQVGPVFYSDTGVPWNTAPSAVNGPIGIICTNP